MVLAAVGLDCLFPFIFVCLQDLRRLYQISSQTDIPLFCTRCIEKQLASSKKPTIEIVWKQRAECLSRYVMEVVKLCAGA